MMYKKYLATLMGAAMLMTTVPVSALAENTTESQSSVEASASEDKKDESQQPPEKPEGAENSSDKPAGAPPAGEKPSGNPPEGNPPEGNPPEGNPPEGNPPEGNPPQGGAPGGNPPQGAPGGMGGANTQTYDYQGEVSGALTADGSTEAGTVTSENETVEAAEKDQNALLAKDGGSLEVKGGTITKTGDDTDGDNCNFYGINSIALSVGEGSQITLSDSTLSADSEGSNGIFATDSGTVYAYNTTISTSAGNSRGLDATYGGTIVASGMDIHTQGDHSASIATDRGGGNISASNSTLNTEGSGSPLLYSTGAIEVDQVTGTASGSQIAGMEGYNTILISNSDLTSTITEATASDPVANGVIIYQSTSGDAETSTGEKALFQALNSTLTSSIASGSLFYVTNTAADIVLSGTTLNYDSENANLLQIEGNNANNWGTPGSNGANVTFTAIAEELNGTISVDSISSLDLYLLDGTTYTGATKITENEQAADLSETPITVNVSADSTWVVTADSTVTDLNVEEGARIVDENGKTVTIVTGEDNLAEGQSDLTITVTGTYSNEVTTGEVNNVRGSSIDTENFEQTFALS